MNTPRVEYVVAMDLEGVIGVDGALPWHLPADLRRFRSLTIGSTVVMGRKTFESIGTPLRQRRNIVLTRDRDFTAPGCEIAHSVKTVLEMTANEPHIYVIGGAALFEAFAGYVSVIHATIVDARVQGDVRFPRGLGEFERTDLGSHDADDRHAFSLRFERWRVPGID
jgi:dihydrofolate reductase